MSEFQVKVVRVGKVEKHPNADQLSITHVYAYPVIIRSGEFTEGDLAVYVPVDACVPSTDPRWAFLAGKWRIRAKRLRGIFSMGLLTTLPAGAWCEGDDVRAALAIEKWEPPPSLQMVGENEADPGLLPVYDVAALRRWPNILVDGEEVWITEKIHGANGRWVHDGIRLWTGSHNCIKRRGGTIWWQVAKKYELEAKLARIPNIALFGEVYGHVQDLKYEVSRQELLRVAFFDALDVQTGEWLGVDRFLSLLSDIQLPVVPTLYRGPWKPDLRDLAEGETILCQEGGHVREGIVIKPVMERFDSSIGRVMFKLHGEGFLLRKEKK